MSDMARQALRAYESESWRRWEMDSVESDVIQDPPAAEEPTALPPNFDEELNQLRRLAREEGRAQGHAQGLQQGLKQGQEEGRAQGFAEGHIQGVEAGTKEALEQGAAKIDIEVQHLAKLLQAGTDALHDLEADIGQALIRLSISIAQQVIRSTIEIEPEKILDTVRDILQLDAGTEGLLRLRVNPEDLTLLQAHLADDPGTRRWRLQADPLIERGGCLAETSLGSIDATLQTRWQRVVTTLGHNMPWTHSP